MDVTVKSPHRSQDGTQTSPQGIERGFPKGQTPGQIPDQWCEYVTAAREVFVSTMSIVYNVETSDKENTESLRETMGHEKRTDGSPVFTPLICIALMVFYVLAMQCISTVAIVRRETNTWRWPLFQIGYMTALAWIGAFIVYQGGRWFGWE